MKTILKSCVAAAALTIAIPSVQAAEKVTTVAAVTVNTNYVLSANELIGQDVLDVKGDKIADIDDLLVAEDGKTVVAILSVGGFVGIGDKLVAVPYQNLTIGADKVMLPGKSKKDLEAMAEFKYRDDAADQRWRQRYVTRMDRTMDTWSDKVASAYEKSADTAEQKGEAVSEEFSEAWDKTKVEFRNLKQATGEKWDEAKLAFERAMNDLEKSWEKATN